MWAAMTRRTTCWICPSSKSGSADVLIQLGVNVEAPFPVVEQCLREANIGFLFALKHHQSMKHAIGPRREIGIRTVFNILGPLTNPAGASRQLLGVFAPELTDLMASALKNLGSEHACVVHGRDGMDEVSLCDETLIAELAGGEIRSYTVKPEDLGLERASIDALTVDGVEGSAHVIREVLDNTPGPALDIVLLNAAFGLLAADRVTEPKDGIEQARDVIASGKAAEALRKLVDITNVIT